jgi:hypothetical protein
MRRLAYATDGTRSRDLADYVLTEDLPDMSTYATKTYVDNAIAAITDADSKSY